MQVQMSTSKCNARSGISYLLNMGIHRNKNILEQKYALAINTTLYVLKLHVIFVTNTYWIGECTYVNLVTQG